MKVCKFGGSCTTTKESLENIQKIAKSEDRCVFVFSAIGKTCFDDKKLTDLLINFYEEKNIEKKFDIYKKIHAKITFLSNLTGNKTDVSRELKSIWKSKDKSFVVSRGEYTTTKIVSEYLKLPFVPAEKIIFFDNGKLDERKTTRKLNFFLKKHRRFCTCGFYGFDAEQKRVVLFERGGGDITGAIIAKLANAPVYENYTDVCGVKTINPKLIPDAKTIKKISYKDMEIMSNYDAKVLHSSVCKILKNTKIKTIIKNIFNLSGEKTIIDNKNHKNNFICYKKRKNEIEIIIKNNQKMSKKLIMDADFEQKMQEIYQKWSKK